MAQALSGAHDRRQGHFHSLARTPEAVFLYSSLRGHGPGSRDNQRDFFKCSPCTTDEPTNRAHSRSEERRLVSATITTASNSSHDIRGRELFLTSASRPLTRRKRFGRQPRYSTTIVQHLLQDLTRTCLFSPNPSGVGSNCR